MYLSGRSLSRIPHKMVEKIIKKQKLLEELQKTREDLEDLEKYIQDFSTFLPLAVCALTPEGIIVDVNSSFKKLTGFELMEIIGKPFETLFLEKEEVKKIIGEREVKARELTLLTKNKEKIPVSIYSGQRKDKEGNLIGLFVGIVDISELKKLQEELEKKVRERTKELHEKIEELEKFQKLAVGRELKMIELKREIKRLKEELEKYKGQT